MRLRLLVSLRPQLLLPLRPWLSSLLLVPLIRRLPCRPSAAQ
ncbi:MAG: hypothetical protein ACR2G8_00730 [Candidatus Limnocylindria bacterium]